jgi:hypothetical protein
MKLMGGYDFPGSLVDRIMGLNPSLTGLISEIQASIFSKFPSFISWDINTDFVCSAFIGWIPEYIDIKRFVLFYGNVAFFFFKILSDQILNARKPGNGYRMVSRVVYQIHSLFLYFFW